MILKDEAFNSDIQTIRNSIDSFAFNKHGEIAVLFFFFFKLRDCVAFRKQSNFIIKREKKK